MPRVGNLTAATYATAYSSFTRKPLIFSMKAKYDGALRVQSRGVLSYSIFIRALSGASREIEFRECAALLLPPTLLSQQVAAKGKGCGKMKILVAVVLGLVTTFAEGATEKVEQAVACPQCHGSGKQSKWVTCPECNGTSEIKSEIHNGSMYNVNYARVNKPTKVNRKRCQNCVKSAKKGKVKEEVDCAKCNGTGKITVLVRKNIGKAK